MNKRLRMGFWVLLVAALAVAGWFTFRSREPEYQGRQLSSWLQEFSNDSTGETDGERTAIEAIKHIGTNAIPTLLENVSAKDSPWKTKFVDFVHKKFDIKLGMTIAAQRQRAGGWGFLALGRDAEPAIPQLATWVNGQDRELAHAAVVALAAIDSEKTIAPLLAALNSSDSIVRLQAAYGFSYNPNRARVAASNLVELCPRTDGTVRRVLASALRSCWDQSKIVVPTLITLLDDSDSTVRGAAARSLGWFGANAKSALPDLIRILPAVGDTNSAMRQLRFSTSRAIVRVQCEMYEGAIIRGPTDDKRVALVFTTHEFAEGADTILNELARHQGRASFFPTGAFLDRPKSQPLVRRIADAGHYVGPHSDNHLLYCSWEDRKKTLLTREEFEADLKESVRKVEPFNPAWETNRFFLPPYEYYNRDITDWTSGMGMTLIGFTPGTRSNADYTGEADKNFVSTQVIFDSILKKELEDPHGLNGFILFLHLGSGPGRADKFHPRFGELLDYLTGKGYQFVRVDELLEPRPAAASAP